MPIETRASARSRYFRAVHLLVLECLEERLAGGIVVGVAAAALADDDTVFLQQVRVVGGGVLHPAIGVMRRPGAGLRCCSAMPKTSSVRSSDQPRTRREKAVRTTPDKQTPTPAGCR